MSSPSRLFQSWPVAAGAVAGVLCYALAATIRPQAPGTEERLDAMQAEIDTLRDRLDTVDALATDAATTAADLQFDQERQPGR